MVQLINSYYSYFFYSPLDPNPTFESLILGLKSLKLNKIYFFKCSNSNGASLSNYAFINTHIFLLE